jgi:heat-inducible transcriptional repressor
MRPVDAKAAMARSSDIEQLNDRSREILRLIVEAYVETGEPVGSRTLSRQQGLNLSPATIRNVMADLEDLGLLMAPHTSAGRLPTEAGLSLFVHGLLELGRLSSAERDDIEAKCAAQGRSVQEALENATSMLSGLSRCAGLVFAPKSEARLKHVEFVHLGPGRALVVMVSESGEVENRVIDVPIGLPASSLVEATNFMAARLVGRTLSQSRGELETALQAERAQLDELTQKLVREGLASWSDTGGYLIVRGQANLLEDVTALEDLERVRALFSALETKEAMLRLIDAAETAEGVQIFIGAQNELFGVTGCSMIMAPYKNAQQQIVGAIGVVGPTRMNYARIIPMVDYTARVIGRMMS